MMIVVSYYRDSSSNIVIVVNFNYHPALVEGESKIYHRIYHW